MLSLSALGVVLWIVVKLASEIKEGDTVAFDRMLLLALRTPDEAHTPIGPYWLQESARDITALGGTTALTILTVAALSLLLIHQKRRQALIFGAIVLLAQLTSSLTKIFVGRPRPELVHHLDVAYTASFPSGHSLMSPVVYFTLAVLLAETEMRPAARSMLIGGAMALVIAIGVSRVYLGVHWPTDVLAGWALGSSIALIGWVTLRRLANTAQGREPDIQQAS